MVEPTHLKNMLVKMGSSSPIFGVKRKKYLKSSPRNNISPTRKLVDFTYFLRDSQSTFIRVNNPETKSKSTKKHLGFQGRWVSFLGPFGLLLQVRCLLVLGSVCLVGGFQPNIEEYLSTWDVCFSNLCDVDDVTLQFNELMQTNERTNEQTNKLTN